MHRDAYGIVVPLAAFNGLKGKPRPSTHLITYVSFANWFL
jgi:hypothetical protein